MILLVVLASVLVGMIFSLLLGVAAIHFNADQTLVGTALNLLGPAAAVVIVRAINMAENPDNVFFHSCLQGGQESVPDKNWKI